ncbi:hypothetical protein PAXRUDRAFT_33882 [Paxillus rubicundulus Ve08.2h10]|uniref:Zn(2)-C6 fungal-type domain-containing protein n=1 Tax=Paxillus rubicundulus Ve08.2h10 TaxID=930991 RepID=A0A0D0E761_9AGAM|nr:hypothetical protein PAXRUDRAFT_33882 [Paxillus rubicundulus Ve08.2h10]
MSFPPNQTDINISSPSSLSDKKSLLPFPSPHMYYTQQTTSQTRDTLLPDPPSALPYPSKHSEPLPSITSMSLPGFPHSPIGHPLPNYRPSYDPSYTPGPPAPHPYPSSHLPPELDQPSSTFNRPQYDVDALNYQDRVHRYASQQESYYRADPSRQSPVDDFSHLDPSLMLNQQPTYLPRRHSATESSSSQSPGEAEDTASRPKKPRREKPRIDLAPNQPLTTQGKPRARVYVACLQCRTRKIRCDGAKPTCHNCTRRAKADDECVYDAAPKRRGPDKMPGARQRMAREVRQDSEFDAVASRRRRRKKHGVASTTQLPANELNAGENRPHTPSASTLQQPSLALDPQLADMQQFQGGPVETSASLHQGALVAGLASVVSQPAPELLEGALYKMSNSQGLHNILSFSTELNVQSSLSTAASEHEESETSEEVANILSEPFLDFARKTWWGCLLTMYTSSSSSSSSSSSPLPTLPLSQRQQMANQVTNDLHFLLRTSNHWFSSISVPRFLSKYFDPDRRDRMQPSFLPAALALATFFKGREKALPLRDIAQGALEASLNARWIDEELAQAAWLIALFEVCTHPLHTSDRCAPGLLMLDMIVGALSLTFVDMGNPAAARFSLRTVPSALPAVGSWLDNGGSFLASTGVDSAYPFQGCSCVSRSLGQRWAASHENTPLWPSPAWDDSWSEAELCWSLLVLAAGHTSYVTPTKRAPREMFIPGPANFALLFPGEAMCMYGGHSGKDTIWSLNYRMMLLWHRYTARFGLNASLEADRPEKALDAHTCGLERTVRLTISHEFRQYIPLATANANGLFQRKKAEEWLTHQANVSQRVVDRTAAVTGQASHTLLYRPFFAFWFMNQISRALTLWG